MEHANVVKSLHKSLRRKFKEGQSTDHIWSELLSDTRTLSEYAKSMHTLATENWEEDSSSNRINWCIKVIQHYFDGNGMEKSVKKEEKSRLFEVLRQENKETDEQKRKIQSQIENFEIEWNPKFDKKLLLDVGSCFNPFKTLSSFHTIGIDISPATEDVLYCDFMNANITTNRDVDSFISFYEHVKSGVLVAGTVDVVVFSLLLSYFPSSEQRLKCVVNAHRMLQLHGILLIITPDSSHQNRHVAMMKSWKNGLERLGFLRFSYEKLPHLHCMAYRKCQEELPCVGSEDLKDSFYIPQDSQELEEKQESISSENIAYDGNVFGDMEL